LIVTSVAHSWPMQAFVYLTATISITIHKKDRFYMNFFSKNYKTETNNADG